VFRSLSPTQGKATLKSTKRSEILLKFLKPSQPQTQVGRPPNLKENKGRKQLRQNKDYLRTSKKSTKPSKLNSNERKLYDKTFTKTNKKSPFKDPMEST